MSEEEGKRARIASIPVLPLKDMVVFPHGVQPLFVGTARSIRALEAAASGDGERRILLLAKRNGEAAEPTREDVFGVGVVGLVLQMLTLPDGMVKVLVEGQARAKLETYDATGEHTLANVEVWHEPMLPDEQADALVREAKQVFERYCKATKVAEDVIAAVTSLDDPGRLLDTLAGQLPLDLPQRQQVLETLDLHARLKSVSDFLGTRIEAGDVKRDIRRRVKGQMEKSQREYYLNEQMKAIQKELGGGEPASSDADEMAKRIEAAGMTREAKEKAETELGKLKLMPPMSAEATVVRGYLDWLVGLPWRKRSRVRRDLRAASRILDEDHYGLEEVKARILEYLAVQGRVRKVKGPVLCLVGPPGVGKTSLGESIARATNRRYVRMALGGVRDEAEIRGHRRTYIGSLPGKVLQKLSKAGVRNPLFLFDEVDKMGQDMRGDPASALLEVLDPEQNHSFNDHYVEVDFDLSDVFFVCTSNSMNIPPALLDRMEVIRLPGYTEEEKLKIATRFLTPKQKRLSGLKDGDFELGEDALRHLVRYYTREAGVRGLEREIAKICRKIVTEQAFGEREAGPAAITEEDIERYNGVRRFTYGLAEEASQVGVATGLAWTSAGGELLSIEAIAVPGKGRQIKTGSLGDVMQESIQAAMTFVRSRAAALGIPADHHENHDIHIHVPEGATPKDGPSAGVGMCTALVSVITGIPVSADVAMTGEITLRGQVLRIGGLKEKLLAARRGGIRHVIIPKENEPDLKEIPGNVLEDLTVMPVSWMDEIIDIALERRPTPREDATELTPQRSDGPQPTADLTLNPQ
ncbi:MAG: endopeptidase La [Gammaproteobacteria bacterium]|nr:endopeptidase La [Gammaproteobacteria bacterium]